MHTDDGNDVWTFNGAVIPNIGLNAVAGRPEGGVRRQPDRVRRDAPRLLRRPRARQGHERRRRARDDELPVVPCVLRPPVLARRRQRPRARGDAGVQRLAHRRVGRHLPRPRSSRWRSRCFGTRSCAPRKSDASPKKGCHSLTFTENPAALDQPSFHDPHWDPLWRALVEEGTILNIHLGSSGQARGHRARRADGRDDHAAADEHLHGRRRPRVVARLQGVPRRSRSRSPRAAPAGSRTSSTGSTARTTCTTCGPGQDFGDRLPSDIFREHILTCFIADPIGIAMRDEIGIDNICWEQDYPHSDSSWPNAPEELRRVAEKYNGARRRPQQDHLRERDALVPLRPVRAPAEGAVHGRRAAGRGRRPRRGDPARWTRAGYADAPQDLARARWRQAATA